MIGWIWLVGEQQLKILIICHYIRHNTLGKVLIIQARAQVYFNFQTIFFTSSSEKWASTRIVLLRFSAVHTYSRLCFKTTTFYSHWPKSIPKFSLSSSEIKVWSTNLSLRVLLHNGLTQNITGTQWLLNSVESFKLGLFGFKSRHNNTEAQTVLTQMTCCKS